MSEAAPIVFAVGCGLGVGLLIALVIRPFFRQSPTEPQPLGFAKVDNGEVVTPVMDNYLMKCCDCGLVHRFQFRAIKVRKRHSEGTFGYDELDPKRYRVQLTAWREDGMDLPDGGQQ